MFSLVSLHSCNTSGRRKRDVHWRTIEKTGVSVKAIRHYEEIALIKSPQRDGKYRVYDDSYVQVLSMIKAAKGLGFTLEELRTIAKAKSQEGLVPMDLLKAELQKSAPTFSLRKRNWKKT